MVSAMMALFCTGEGLADIGQHQDQSPADCSQKMYNEIIWEEEDLTNSFKW